jgi:diguanylate cyclase (GGDEF)-like protein/PAS domain S-box-containing protein
MYVTVGRKIGLAFIAAFALIVAMALVSLHTSRELASAADALQRRWADDGSRMPQAVSAQVRRAEQAARTSRIVLAAGATITLVLAPIAVMILLREARVRRAAEEALARSEARLRAATDGSLDAFYVLTAVRDAGGVVLDFEFAFLNRQAEVLLGIRREAVVGQRLCELIPSTRTSGFLQKYALVMQQDHPLEEEFEVTSPDVRAAWVRQQVVPLADGVAITSRDVTDRKQQEEALRALSLIDELTGLYNRRGFLTLAQQQLKLARRGHRELLLLFVDMDDFKEINDTYGHREGDVALQRTTAILRQTFRDSDIIARLGGDEFVVLAADTSRGSDHLIIDRLRAALRERNEHEGYPYRLSFSVGMAHFDPESPPSIEDLLATADRMLYEQKRYKNESALQTASLAR